MKRTAVALVASVGLHLTLLAGGLRLPAAFAFSPNAYLVPISVDDVRELPLQRPLSSPGARAEHGGALEARRTRPSNAGGVRPVASKPRDADPAPAARPPQDASGRDVAETARRGDLSAYGPEGSRVVAVLRLDRLRAAPEARADIAVVDDLLRLVPDRQRLLENTNLDLYRDFDVLLVATPNPFDVSATFVAARHRLDDKALRAALDRGAKAGGGAITWRKERGRYVGVHDGASGTGAAGGDERLLLLPAPGLVVIASPVYAKLVLDGSPEGGRDATGTPPGSGKARSWSDLVARVDAEDAAIPADATFVLTASNLVHPGGGGVAGASGKNPDALPTPPGQPTPRRISILIGTNAKPFVELVAEFERDAEAQSWEGQWPAWKQDLLANPLVLLARADPLLSRAELRRDGRTVVLRTPATNDELLGLLRIVAAVAASGDAGRAPGSSRSPGQGVR